MPPIQSPQRTPLQLNQTDDGTFRALLAQKQKAAADRNALQSEETNAMAHNIAHTGDVLAKGIGEIGDTYIRSEENQQKLAQQAKQDKFQQDLAKAHTDYYAQEAQAKQKENEYADTENPATGKTFGEEAYAAKHAPKPVKKMEAPLPYVDPQGNKRVGKQVTNDDGTVSFVQDAKSDPIVGKEKPDSGSQADKKRFDNLDTVLQTGGRNAADFKKHQQIQSAADRVLVAGQQGETQEGGLDSRQIHEIALASAALLGGGTGTAQGTVEALVPHSMGTSAAGIEEWLTSEPKGTGQQEFVKRMLETAEREKHLAGEKIKSFRAEALTNASDLQDVDAEKYAKRMKKYLGSDAEFDENGNYIQKPFGFAGNKKAPPPGAKDAAGMALAAPPTAHPQADEAIKWINDPKNANDPRLPAMKQRLSPPPAAAAGGK